LKITLEEKMAYENNSSHSAQKENKKNNKYKCMKIRFSIFKSNENKFLLTKDETGKRNS